MKLDKVFYMLYYCYEYFLVENWFCCNYLKINLFFLKIEWKCECMLGVGNWLVDDFIVDGKMFEVDFCIEIEVGYVVFLIEGKVFGFVVVVSYL